MIRINLKKQRRPVWTWNISRMRKFITQLRCCMLKRTIHDFQMAFSWRMKEGDQGQYYLDLYFTHQHANLINKFNFWLTNLTHINS